MSEEITNPESAVVDSTETRKPRKAAKLPSALKVSDKEKAAFIESQRSTDSGKVRKTKSTGDAKREAASEAISDYLPHLAELTGNLRGRNEEVWLYVPASRFGGYVGNTSKPGTKPEVKLGRFVFNRDGSDSERFILGRCYRHAVQLTDGVLVAVDPAWLSDKDWFLKFRKQFRVFATKG